MIRDAILDRPFDAAGIWMLLIERWIDSVRIEYPQILQWITVHDHQVSEIIRLDAAELIRFSEHCSAVAGGVLNYFQWLKAGFFVQLQFAQEAESIHLVNEPCIFAGGDHSAALRKIPQCREPDLVVLFPVDFIRVSPAKKEG